MSFIVIYLGGLPLYFEVYTTKLFCSSHHFKIGAKKVVKMACLYNYYGNFCHNYLHTYFKILVCTYDIYMLLADMGISYRYRPIRKLQLSSLSVSADMKKG